MKDKFDFTENMYFEKDGERINIMDIEPDSKILDLAREYDAKQTKKKSKQRRKSYVHIAAMVMICFVGLSAITLETSDAFRARFYQILSIEDDGAAELLSQDEYDLIGDWTDYWYPTYIPDGFALQAAEKTELEKIMLFASETGAELRIFEHPLETATAVDTDYTSFEEIKIGYHNGCLLVNEEYGFLSIYWLTEDRQICIEMTGVDDRDMLIEIAEKMKYRER
jgi:hypothetical protein